MKFKNHADYMEQRTALLNAAQELLDSGEVGEKYQNAKKAVVELDNAYEAYATEQANLNALNGTQKPMLDVMGMANKGGVIGSMGNELELFDSMEYRKAFMNHVVKGEAIPTEFKNANETTTTTDAGAMIPTTVLNKIIEKMEATGMILPLVTRTSYKGGLAIPTSSVKPTATWVAERGGSDIQKKTATKDGMITFAYHKLRCAVAVSLEMDTMALSAFESALISNVSEAMVKALETAVIKGSGSGQPKGILTETVEAAKNLDLPEGAAITYGNLCEMEAKLDLAYETSAVWFMTKSTFMKIISMVDDNKQPIARVNYGIGGKPERTILGRTVILNDYMSSYANSVTENTVIAFLFNPKDYVLNTNLNIAMKKYEDNDTDDTITKAIMLVDGKVVDKNSLVTMTIKNS